MLKRTGTKAKKTTGERPTRQKPLKNNGSRRPGKTKKKRKQVITVPNPLGRTTSLWKIELLGVEKQEFLDLWAKDSDRIGFNVNERTIYDRSTVIGKIVQEVTLSRSRLSEEE